MYIGNTPAENYASFLTETFTVSATTNYTLSHAVTNENDIRLVINGVVQQPGSGKAYTASNTTLTLTSATVSGDSMYAVYLGRALQTVNPPNASVGTSQLADSSVTSAKLGTGATNTPGFHAFLSANMEGLSDASTVKVNCNTERYDATGVYDNSSNYRFTPGVAGKYFIYGGVMLTADSTGNMREAEVYIYKNGSSIGKASFNYVDNYSQLATPTISIVDVADDNDYYELYAQVNTQNSSNFKIIADSTQQRTYFGAYRIIT